MEQCSQRASVYHYSEFQRQKGGDLTQSYDKSP